MSASCQRTRGRIHVLAGRRAIHRKTAPKELLNDSEQGNDPIWARSRCRRADADDGTRDREFGERAGASGSALRQGPHGRPDRGRLDWRQGMRFRHGERRWRVDDADRAGQRVRPDGDAAISFTVNGAAATTSPAATWASGGTPSDIANGYKLTVVPATPTATAAPTLRPRPRPRPPRLPPR